MAATCMGTKLSTYKKKTDKKRLMSTRKVKIL